MQWIQNEMHTRIRALVIVFKKCGFFNKWKYILHEIISCAKKNIVDFYELTVI